MVDNATAMILILLISVCCSVAATLAIIDWHLKQTKTEQKRFIKTIEGIVDRYIQSMADLNDRVDEIANDIYAEMGEGHEQWQD